MNESPPNTHTHTHTQKMNSLTHLAVEREDEKVGMGFSNTELHLLLIGIVLGDRTIEFGKCVRWQSGGVLG